MSSVVPPPMPHPTMTPNSWSRKAVTRSSTPPDTMCWTQVPSSVTPRLGGPRAERAVDPGDGLRGVDVEGDQPGGGPVRDRGGDALDGDREPDLVRRPARPRRSSSPAGPGPPAGRRPRGCAPRRARKGPGDRPRGPRGRSRGRLAPDPAAAGFGGACRPACRARWPAARIARACSSKSLTPRAAKRSAMPGGGDSQLMQSGLSAWPPQLLEHRGQRRRQVAEPGRQEDAQVDVRRVRQQGEGLGQRGAELGIRHRSRREVDRVERRGERRQERRDLASRVRDRAAAPRDPRARTGRSRGRRCRRRTRSAGRDCRRAADPGAATRAGGTRRASPPTSTRGSRRTRGRSRRRCDRGRRAGRCGPARPGRSSRSRRP